MYLFEAFSYRLGGGLGFVVSAKVVVSPNNKLIASGGQESHVTEADGLWPMSSLVGWLGY